MAAGVEFEEDKNIYARPAQRMSMGGMPAYGSPAGLPVRGFAGWLIKRGWAKSESGAQKIQVIIIIINIVVTFAIIRYFI